MQVHDSALGAARPVWNVSSDLYSLSRPFHHGRFQRSGRILLPPPPPQHKAVATGAEGISCSNGTRANANGESCKTRRNYTVFLSRLTKKITKICAEHQGLTATMREDARGFQYLFVIVI